MSATVKAKKFSFWSLFKISRPLNLVIVAFAQLMTAYFLVETTRKGLPILQDINLYLIILSTVILTAAGYMINDYYDVKIDYINKPDEVIIGKGMKRRVVIFFHSFLNLTGVGIGLIVSPRIALINFIASFLLWLYSNSLKRLPFIGNFTVALLTGTAIWMIGYYYQKSELLVLTYAIFAFFINLIREILKDIEDRQGDRKHGCRTLPIVFGFRNTKRIIFLIAFCFICAILVVTFKINNTQLYFYFGGLSILFFIFMYKIYMADRKAHFTQLSILSKMLMITGILSMAFL
ncbi:geranylgeranylglycerol-phosphate geranylgeranyltransferase [Aquiflexum gelatinilyticum]|uniref:Geranylgeranylglycerol-phosphate geranylgeranyltransferase n=1 Tax=Aquiflexum gelatinilyticum TaxID=2961943 RepID=A0A9X2T3M9_9BACT|nr:geranylgeranylglycerol-phosphate geranylgeranyltransferase [Aquiflexum gelatinilyticum]MCR9016535.1 geranylgeranylglycerol-phosphate geranylgeranyltransferase [Aquiflexum gelatinilyticum]MCS4436562.1 geranylgeranylglycerol-phosphate geranylgeranyltransferase [Aquiflexum gelatinilyticum]